jgi:type VI secretion system protein ImpH
MIAKLLSDPTAFDFFQAVRLLQRAHAGVLEPVGQDGPPEQESVRFTSHVSLAFPSSPVVEVRPPPDARGDGDSPRSPRTLPGFGPFRMQVAFMGMAGTVGVMPHHYTSLVLARERDKDPGLREFLDLFNHRLVSLFYRAWQKYRFPVDYERVATGAARDGAPPETSDAFTQFLFATVGLGTPALRNRLAIDDRTLLHYAGLFAHSVRSASGLEQTVGDYFNLPAQIVCFHGQWLHLSPESRSQLPRRGEPPGNVGLGSTLVLGDRVWDVQSKFLVRLGPLTYAGFRQFMPGQPAYRELFEMVRTYVGTEFDFDLQPVLLAGEVPECALGGRTGGHYLGQNTWMRTLPYPRDFADAYFTSADL